MIRKIWDVGRSGSQDFIFARIDQRDNLLRALTYTYSRAPIQRSRLGIRGVISISGIIVHR